jgi:hypothetical protein
MAVIIYSIISSIVAFQAVALVYEIIAVLTDIIVYGTIICLQK